MLTRTVASVLSIGILGGVLVSSVARADDPVCLVPGVECLAVPVPGQWTFGTELVPPLPPNFFGPGTVAPNGPVPVMGIEGGPALLIQRPLQVCRDSDQQDHLLEIPIELVQLQLQSVAPIFVPGSGPWHMEILCPTPAPGHITLENWEPYAGGWLHVELFVQPLYLFHKLEPPFETRAYDTALAGLPPIPLSTPVGVAIPWVEFGVWGTCNQAAILGLYSDLAVPGPCSAPFPLVTPDGLSIVLPTQQPGAPPCGPPPNDSCDTPLLLSGDVLVPLNTLFATPSGPGGFVLGPNLWFAYIAETTGVLRIDTCGSEFETRIAVYDTPACGPEAVPIATSSDYPGCYLGTRLHTRELIAGEIVYIEVGGLHGTRGVGWLQLSQNDDVCVRSITPYRPPYFDVNDDGALDLLDLVQLQECFTGSDGTATMYCEWLFNTNVGTAVDFADVTLFLESLTGPVGPPMPTAEPLAALCPRDGLVTTDGRPGFAWNPCDIPDPALRYRLSLHRVPADLTPADALLLTAPQFVLEDLVQPWVNYPSQAAPLLPGKTYVWQVEAYSLLIPGNVLCSGPANRVVAQPVTPEEKLAELLRELERIGRELEKAGNDLEENPLVKEVRLIELIGSILRGEVDLGAEAVAALQAFINCDNNALNALDADKLDKALATLQAVIKLILVAEDLKPAARTALNGLIDRIQQVRDGLADLQTIKEFTSPDFDIWDYLKKQLHEGFNKAVNELAEKALAKVLGKKAAGAILSIVLDLYAFGDALFKLATIEDLRRAWNLLLLQAITAAGQTGLAIPCDYEWINRYVWTNCNEYTGAKFRVEPWVKCWRPKPGGTAGEGSWVDCAASFTNQGTTTYGDKEDATRIEFGSGDMTVVKPQPSPQRQYHFSLKFDTECVGSGPCVIGVMVEITKSNGEKEKMIFLSGAKSPPAGD